MAALLHIDILRQHTPSYSVFTDLGAVLSMATLSPRLRPVASWRIGPNGRPVQHWTAVDVATRVPPD